MIAGNSKQSWRVREEERHRERGTEGEMEMERERGTERESESERKYKR